jgi:DNA-binding NarL/FixJ family response regulator
MLNIAIVEDHAMVRQSFANLLSQESGWCVKEQYGCFDSAIEGIGSTECSLFLLDISLPEGNGLDVLAHLQKHRPDIKVAMLSMYEHFYYVSRAIEAGAMAYVSKRSAAQELILAIHCIQKGTNYLSPEIANHFAFTKNKDEGKLGHLTPREREIFALLALGKSPKRIAQLTNTMPKTVLTHRTNIFRKTRTKTQFELLQLGLKQGLLQLSDLI